MSSMELMSSDEAPGSKRSREEGASQAGFVETVRWYPKGDPRNREIMAQLKAEKPRVYKKMLLDKWTKKKFPYKDYGTVHRKRGQTYTVNRYGKSWADANEAQRVARDADGWIGAGAYHPFSWKQFTRGVKDVGHLLGPKILGGLEDLALRKLTGMGAYNMTSLAPYDQESFRYSSFPTEEMKQNYIMSDTTTGNFGRVRNVEEHANQLIGRSRPSIGFDVSLDETNSITITHSEYISDITPTSTSFQSQVFLNLNPGLPATFPWLSNMAQFYEEYEFHQLVFTFKSMVTEGNSTASGTVIMATQYNPSNPQFTSKQVMENYDYANSVKVTSDAHHGLECDPTKSGGNAIEYVRTGVIPTNQDLKTYDLATFQLATTGAAANLTIGELWVHYKVKLRKSKIPQIGQITRVNSAHLQFTTVASKTASTTLNGATVSSNLTGYSFTDTSFTLPAYITAGKYQLVLGIAGSTISAVWTCTASVGGVAGGATVTNLIQTQASSSASSVFNIDINNTSIGTGVTFTINCPGLTSSLAGGVIALNQVFSST